MAWKAHERLQIMLMYKPKLWSSTLGCTMHLAAAVFAAAGNVWRLRRDNKDTMLFSWVKKKNVGVWLAWKHEGSVNAIKQSLNQWR